MEAAAIGVANTALNSVVQTAVTTITNKIGLLLGVQEELFFIKEELEMMQGFLKVAKTENAKDVLVSIWVKQVQDLAFDVEDCLHEASVHLVKKSCLHVMCSVKKRDDIANKIRMLKTRIEDVSKRNLRYELIKKGNSGQTCDKSAYTRSISNVEALMLVGLNGPKRMLVNLIRTKHIELRDKPWNGKVISVVGMGGLGKTTLVREVYDYQELRNEFNNHFAWVTVQHPFNKDEFIESLAKQISSKAVDDKEETMEENKKKFEELSKKTIKESLEKKVKEYFKDKKYLIVLDDLSSESEWVKINDVLSPNNESRIIVTTRHRTLAEQISHPDENIYKIKKLSKKDALELFFKSVYKTTKYHLMSDEDPINTETTERNSKAEGESKAHNQCITNTITEENDREIKKDLPHENKCNIKNGSTSTDTIEGDSKAQKQWITKTITEEEDREIIEELLHENKGNMKNGSSSTETTEENSGVPEECITKDMETQAGLIVKSCDKLPLAIVTIGSYLATKQKKSDEWMKMHKQLSSELTNNLKLGMVKTVLTSSYDGLPYHLKPSLLYLSVFHNHKEIRRSRIIRRWMADGYVMEGRVKKAEEIEKGYFYDLMGRSLILPSQMSTIVNGNVKTCNIHDIMYELILGKAVDESMVSVLEDGELISMTDKVRHLVITGGSCTRGKVLESVELSHMRSLSIFGEVGDYLKYSRMKLLRVLDLEGTINLNNRDLRRIGKLRHLKYLGLRGTKIRKLPNSLGKLSELETLDIRNTNVVQLQTGLTKLHKLSYLRGGSDRSIDLSTPILEFFAKHICSIMFDKCPDDDCLPTIKGQSYVSRGVRFFSCICLTFLILPCLCLEGFLKDKALHHFSGGVRVPQGIGKLRSLNTIGVIDIGGSKNLAKEIKNLTNLHKLAVSGFTKENGETLAEVINELKHLKSLVLKDADNLGLKCCLESVSSPPKHLQSLKLEGCIGKIPDWISSLENLEKIHLKCTFLTKDIEEKVKELCFSKGTFLMLQVMILEELDGLESMSIKETALKRLELLKIRKGTGLSSKIEGGVSGLEFLVQLKEMELVGYSDGIEFVRKIKEQLKNNPNKPILRVIKDKF